MREVVHVETQEQYDYVTEKLNYNRNVNKWLVEREKTCLRIDEKLYSSINYCKKYGDVKIISFDEFKSRYEPQLKIGDTFEHNGFICEVKEKIKEKNWYRIIDRIGNLYFEKMPKERAEQAVDHKVKSITEITNKEFIKQLEENAQ